MKTLKLKLVAAMITIPIFAGCDGNQEAKNMEQIYAEEGVPVRVETVQPVPFSSKLAYNAVLSGTRESSAYAAVADNIDRINYKVGDYVEKDAVVLTFPTDNPSARYFQAKVAYENSLATYERMKNYYDVGGLSKQDFDNARAAYEVAEADWNATRQSVLVKAPISGILTRINVRESENVEKDDELFAVAQIDRLKARIWVSDKEIGNFEKGQMATTRWGGITLKGRVVQVDLSMNRERQAFAVVTEFDNPDHIVKSGVTARVDVATYQNPDGIIVERKNITNDGRNNFVYVVENGVARKRIVELGRSDGLAVEITGGLNEGDTLIIEGQLHLDDGKKIRIIESEQTRMTQY